MHSQSSVDGSPRQATTARLDRTQLRTRGSRITSGHCSDSAVLSIAAGDGVAGTFRLPQIGDKIRNQHSPRHCCSVADPSIHSHSVLPPPSRHAITSGARFMHVLNIPPKFSSLQIPIL